MLMWATRAAVLTAILAQGTSGQAIIVVPGDYPSIQDAVDVAVPGDTVLVGPGTYAENVVINAKAITLTSVDGPRATIIDGGGVSPALTVTNDVSADGVVDGFTLTNGMGGGVNIDDSSPTIRRCLIVGNQAGIFGVAAGVGVFGPGITEGNPPPRPRFVHCTIADNATDFPGSAGAYVASDASAIFENCIIWGHAPGESVAQEGGIASVYLSFSDVENNPSMLLGAIDVAPMFDAAGDYSLSVFSPLVDAGDPNAPYDPDGSRADVGAIPTEQPFQWEHLGHALGSDFGIPVLLGAGELTPASATSLSLDDARPLAPAFLVVSAVLLQAPFKGGVMLPDVDIVKTFTVDGFGSAALAFPWPPGVPPGFTTYMQWWIKDDTGPLGYAASNGLAAIAQ